MITQEMSKVIPPQGHPWRFRSNAKRKLKEARKEAKLRQHRSETGREVNRRSKRKARGIPVDLPVMKSWDFVKGRVTERDIEPIL